jgi:hypothetical protein
MISARYLFSTRDDHYVRPDTLIRGKYYGLLESNCPGRLVQETVQFVSFTACPGTVIVLDSQNQRFCTSRDRLYLV